jgi:Ser/Thr protein kinase RdoA (MazF antagonist)
MKESFNKSSYLSQVRRLRALASKALVEYPIKVKTINFIHHGENTTFRIVATNGQTYLLRIHRNDYHTKSAIVEEMSWLNHLSKRGLSVPNPVTSKNGNLVETIEHHDIQGSRNCSVFKWIHGGFIRKSVKPQHMFEIGQLLADFQNNTPKGKTDNRQYWTAGGLVGSNPKFGSLDKLVGISSKQQNTLTNARKTILKKLKQFEKRYPSKQGLIHADLHFGNIVSNGKNLGAIDFDDCGYGFFAYDLAIPYISVQSSLGAKKKHLFAEYKKALIDGYKTKRKWDKEDDTIFPHLVTARKLLMLGWLNSRSDNPRLKKYLKVAVKNTLLHLKNPL